jgi:hypothetical protein
VAKRLLTIASLPLSQVTSVCFKRLCFHTVGGEQESCLEHRPIGDRCVLMPLHQFRWSVLVELCYYSPTSLADTLEIVAFLCFDCGLCPSINSDASTVATEPGHESKVLPLTRTCSSERVSWNCVACVCSVVLPVTLLRGGLRCIFRSRAVLAVHNEIRSNTSGWFPLMLLGLSCNLSYSGVPKRISGAFVLFPSSAIVQTAGYRGETVGSLANSRRIRVP